MATVLIVEDERDLREVVAEALSEAGYQVVDASDGAEALDKLRACHPSVVLLDLMMPRMNGWQFRAAQQQDPEVSRIPVIVISALGWVADLDAAEFLQKPFELDRLLTAVRHQVHDA
jgi:two-component system, OmpR family, alkaline phosphatase synthesis response regulator PhoP